MNKKKNGNSSSLDEHRAARSCISLRALAAMALAAGPAVSLAAPWDFSAVADMGVVHTSNILLAPDGQEQSETVFTILPQFILETDGERTKADIRYRPEAYFYDEFSDQDTVFHIVDATLSTSLIRDRLFLDLGAANYQSIVSPQGSLPTWNVPITENRVDSRVFEVRPRWQQSFGDADLDAVAGYRYLDAEGGSFQESHERFGTLELDNHGRQSGLAWGLNYEYRRLEYDIDDPFEFQRGRADIGFWATSALRLFVGGGAETSIEQFQAEDVQDEFWEVGFQYAPNDRLNLELAAGERSYGSSLRADFSYDLRRGNLTITYTESPTTRALTFFGRRPLVDRDDLDGILDRPGNADRFVQKRGEMLLNIELNKSELDLRVFTERREQLTTAQGQPRPEEDLSGVSARWIWRLGSRTSVDLGLEYANRDDRIFEDELRSVGIGADYSITGRTSFRLEVNRSEQEGQVISDGDYTETQGRLLIRVELM